MIHPKTELRYISAEIGYGVFATAFIPKGTITWALDPLDQRLAAADVARLGPEYDPLIEKYSYFDRAGRRILCWDFARFMNHSCEANSMSPGLNFELALRDIQAGEQLTSDYGALNLERLFECFCGETTCRRIIRPEDFETFAGHWDKRLRAAFRRIADVEQVLWAWVQEKSEIDHGLLQPRRIPSILNHRFAGAAGASAVPARRGARREESRWHRSEHASEELMTLLAPEAQATASG